MSTVRRRLIAVLSLAAYLLANAHGYVLLAALASSTQSGVVVAARWVGIGSEPASRSKCKHCRDKAESNDATSHPTHCPCCPTDGDGCPMPDGCSMCNAAKAPCPAPVFRLAVSCDVSDESVSDSILAYDSPPRDESPRPPRV